MTALALSVTVLGALWIFAARELRAASSRASLRDATANPQLTGALPFILLCDSCDGSLGRHAGHCPRGGVGDPAPSTDLRRVP